MLVRVHLDYDHKHVSRSIPRVFPHDSIQQLGTYIQYHHSAPSIKGKSRSVSKIRTVHDATNSDFNLPTGSSSPKKNKVSTNRPSTSDGACTLNITVIYRKIDHTWHLRYQSGNCKSDGNHKGRIPVHSSHISQSIKHLPNDVDTFIQVSIQNHVSYSIIYQLVLQLYQQTLTEVDICHYRDKLSYNLLRAAFDLPYGTPIEKLITEFRLKKDVSFCYVLHVMDSGFVNYCKSKGDDHPLLGETDDGDDTNGTYISVYQK